MSWSEQQPALWNSGKEGKSFACVADDTVNLGNYLLPFHLLYGLEIEVLLFLGVRIDEALFFAILSRTHWTDSPLFCLVCFTCKYRFK